MFDDKPSEVFEKLMQRAGKLCNKLEGLAQEIAKDHSKLSVTEIKNIGIDYIHDEMQRCNKTASDSEYQKLINTIDKIENNPKEWLLGIITK